MGLSQMINTNSSSTNTRQNSFESASSHSRCNLTYAPSLTHVVLTATGKETRLGDISCVLSQGWQTAAMNAAASIH